MGRVVGRATRGVAFGHRRLARAQAGTAVVEMAVILPLFILFVIGILDFGRAMNYFNDATHLANEGARYATVNFSAPSSACGSKLQDYIRCQADTTEMQNNSTVCVDFPNGPSPNPGLDPVEVKVKTTFNWLPYFHNALGFNTSSQLTGTARMLLEQTPTNYSADAIC